MTRRVTQHKKHTFDGEELLILTIWEDGANKEAIKKENKYSKTQEILINRGCFYEYVKKA